MTAPGGVIATVYVEVLPRVQKFAAELRRSLRQSSRELRQIDREIEPVVQALQRIGKVATGIVPGVRLARQSLLALGAHAVVGGLVIAAGAVTTLSGALLVIPAAGVAAASVMGALGVGLFGVSDAMKQFFKNEEKFHDKVADLSENAQATLNVIDGLRGEILDFRNSVQDRLFAGIDDVVKSLATTFLPRLTTHFGNLADQINLGAKDLARFVQSGSTLRDIDTVTGNIELGFGNLRTALIPAATAFRDIVTVGSTFLPELSRELSRVVVRFSQWVSQMRATGQLAEFIQNGIDAFKTLLSIVGNVGRAIRAILTAAQESGNGLLDTLDRLTENLANFLESTRGQNILKSFFDSTRGAAEALAPVLASLAELIFVDIFPVFEAIAKTVGPSVARFFSSLGDAIQQAAPSIEVFAAGFAQFIDGIIPALPAVARLVSSIAQLVGILAGRLGPIVAEIATAISNVLVPVFNVLSAIFLVISPEALKFVVVLGTVVVAVSALITVVRGVQALFGLFSGGLELLTKGFGKTQGAAAGFVGFLSGPWGVAIGLASIALGLFLSNADDATGEVNSLADAMVNAADSTRQASREWIANQLEQKGVAETGAKLGLTINDLVDAYMGLPDAQTRVSNALRDNGKNADISHDAMETFFEVLSQGPEKYDAAVAAAQRKNEADQRSISIQQLLANGFKVAGDALAGVSDRLREYNDLALASVSSDIAYQNQLARTNEELANGARTLDIHTQEGRDNLGAITELIRVGNQHVADLQQQHVGTEQVTAVMQQQREAIIGMVTPFFNSREAAEQYLITLGLIPSHIETQVTLAIGQALAAAQQVARVIANLPGTIFGGKPLQRASGGPVPAGQWTWVGEEGPELVRFGRAARVYSTDESAAMSRDVGAVDAMTMRGRGSASTYGSGGGAWNSDAIQVANKITVDPTVRVYVDGQELRGMVRVEMNERDRQLQRLVTANAGGRR